MATSGEERTEQPTPRRRAKARKQGQIARSADLSAAFVLLAGTAALSLFGLNGANDLAAFMRASFLQIAAARTASGREITNELGNAAFHTLVAVVGPVAGAAVLASLVASLIQLGGRPTFSPLRFDPQRISPLRGVKAIFGINAVFEALKALLKTGAVGVVALLALLPYLHGLASRVGLPPGALGHLLASGTLGVAQKAGGAYLLVGVLDYAWRRRRVERSLKMTKQELREEQRQHSLPAEIKRAQRRRAVALMRGRMMAAVPKADVVVTNPVHYAVALLYDGSRPAPEVVAKGKELLAKRIREVAEEHGVPVLEDPPLARALYQQTEIGDVIPPTLYAAVARVLAFVYRLSGRRPAPVRERSALR